IRVSVSLELKSSPGPAISSRAAPRHPRATLSHLLAAPIRGPPEAVALVPPGKPALTYGGLGAKIDAIAAGLAAAGFGRGSRTSHALAAENHISTASPGR